MGKLIMNVSLAIQLGKFCFIIILLVLQQNLRVVMQKIIDMDAKYVIVVYLEKKLEVGANAWQVNFFNFNN